MKKLKVIALLICLCAGFTFADEYYWPRSYYVTAGFGVMVSKGDFNEHAIKGKDSAGVVGLIHPPALEFIATPDFMLGVNLGAFSSVNPNASATVIKLLRIRSTQEGMSSRLTFRIIFIPPNSDLPIR